MSTQIVSRKKSKKSRARTGATAEPETRDPLAEGAGGDAGRTALHERLGLAAALRGDADWARHLQRRKRPQSLAKLFQAGKAPLIWWGIRDTFLGHAAMAEVVADLPGAERTAAVENGLPWNAVTAYELARQAVDDAAVRSLCDLHRLQHSPRLRAGTDLAGWWQVIENALGWGEVAARSEVGNDWLQQLWRVEFPATLAYLFPEFTQVASDVDESVLQFENLVATSLDPSGLPRPESWPDFRALVASWTRSACLLRALRRKLRPQTWTLLSAAWRQTVRASRPDGNQMLLAPAVGRGWRALTRLAQTLPLKRRTRALLAHAATSSRQPAHKPPKALAKLPLCDAPDHGLPWILQSSWRPAAEKIAVWADATRQQLELATRVPLLAGSCQPLLQVDSHAVTPIAAPHTSCWYADDDVQVLELQYDCEREVQLDRLVLLAVQDRIALIADTVTLPSAAQLEYQLRLPLAADVTADAESETQEHYLRVAGKIQALVLPLAVPEWRAARSPQAFATCETPGGAALQLTQRHTGCGMHAAVWLDLDPRRSRRPRTWRQLTVARDLTNQPGDQAVAYRVRSGDEQWLLYRRVQPEMNCFSALGWHFNCEFYFGKIEADRTLRELVRIDWPPVDAG